MPEKKQIINLPGKTATQILAISYQVFQQLNWPLLYGTDSGLIGKTVKKWNRNADQITVGILDGQLNLDSKMVNGEAFDMGGRNKANLRKFEEAFHAIAAVATTEQIHEWSGSVQALKENTRHLIEEEAKEREELQKVMDLSGKSVTTTYAIMALNVIVFVWMVVKGANFMSIDFGDLLRWGGDHLDLTTTGEWWRIITSMFVHGDILHLAGNMYCLYMAGIYLEPLLGKRRLMGAFLCTGVFGGLLSLAWHNPPQVSVGASGAIFGLYGVFLALLSTNVIPKTIRQQLLKSVAIFIGYTLIYGVKSGIDNAAHVGGLLSGLVIGYFFYFGIRQKSRGKESKKRPNVEVILIMIVTAVAAFIVLADLKKKSDPDRARELRNIMVLTNTGDGNLYEQQLQRISELEDKALAPLQPPVTQSDSAMATQLQTVSLPQWKIADSILNVMEQYNVPPVYKQHIQRLKEYVSLREEQVRIFNQFAHHNPDITLDSLDANNQRIQKTVEEIKKN